MVKDKRRKVTVHLAGGEWVADMTWAEGRTAEGPQEITIRPAVDGTLPGHGLSSTVLRSVNFAKAIAGLRETDEMIEQIHAGFDGVTAKIAQAYSLLQSEGITDAYLAVLADCYVSLISKGVDKPVDRIAEVFKNKTVSTIRGHLWTARQRGILEGGSSGRPGGELTSKAADAIRARFLGA